MHKALLYTKRLEGVGLTRSQAETHLMIISEVMKSDMATKAELLAVKSELQAEIVAAKGELKTDMQSLRVQIDGLRTEFKSDLKQLSLEMTIRLGIMQVVSVGLLVSLTRLLAHWGL